MPLKLASEVSVYCDAGGGSGWTVIAAGEAVTAGAPAAWVSEKVHDTAPSAAPVIVAVGPVPLEGDTAVAGVQRHVQSPGAVSTVSPALSSAEAVSVVELPPPIVTVCDELLTETEATVPTIVTATFWLLPPACTVTDVMPTAWAGACEHASSGKALAVSTSAPDGTLANV